MGYKSFDSYAAEYDSWFIKNSNVLESEVKLVASCLQNAGEVLSIGCGSGLFEKILRDEYGIIIRKGIEPSSAMAEIAVKRGMDVTIATGEEADYGIERFDTVLFNGCPCYMQDLESALRMPEFLEHELHSFESFYAGHYAPLSVLERSESCRYCLEHLFVLLALSFFFFYNCGRSFGNEVLIVQHAIHAGEFSGKLLFFFLKTFNFLCNINKLCKRNIDICICNHYRYSIIGDTGLIRLNIYF
jgi:SAM-dependent methyltransferase